jgi:hypothetical protein
VKDPCISLFAVALALAVIFCHPSPKAEDLLLLLSLRLLVLV